MRKLLTSSYDDELIMLSDYCKAVGVKNPLDEHRDLCREVLTRHQNLVAVRDGVRTLVSFLQNRGFKIAVLSNASQAFAIPFRRFDVAGLFNHVSFSCEIGAAKPAPEVYRRVCAALDVSEAECLFVGDSLQSDYAMPRSLGMRALCLKPVNGDGKPDICRIDEIAWRSLGEPDPMLPLIYPGKPFVLSDSKWITNEIFSLPDDKQGRYNVVAKISATDSNGLVGSFIVKRYLSPNSAHIEDLAYQVMGIVGLPGCPHALIDGSEPLLIMEEAVGVPWEQAEIDDAAMRSIGSHCAFAYIIGNADIRPRNTLVSHANGDSKVTVIDLEHCFFDRAVVLPTDFDALNPNSVDSLSEAKINESTKHRVLSKGATRRARRSFLAVEDRTTRLPQLFRDGWIDAYRRVKQNGQEIVDLVLNRLYQNPPLIIGTQSYRRAMAKIDVEDMRARIEQEPEIAFEQQY